MFSHERHVRHLGAYIAFALALIVVAALIFALYPAIPTLVSAPMQNSSAAPRGFPQDAPAPTPQDTVAAQHGFQYLVSYTSNGFAPATLSIKKGETIRFTNSSTGTLTLTIIGAAPQSLAHAAYYEHTFATTGSFTYSDGTKTGTVTVK